MIDKALIITVGTGVGEDEEEAARSVAHGILASIKNSNPTKVVFVVSEKSRRVTLPEVRRLAGELPDSELLKLDGIDDVNESFEKVCSRIAELRARGYEVVVDFTFGTKAMSAGAVLAATCEGTAISYVAGERHRGKVPNGLEKVMVYSPVRGIQKIQERIAAELFDVYQFESSIRILRALVDAGAEPELKSRYRRLISVVEGYMMWDRFNHRGSFEILSGVREVPPHNKEFLGSLLNSKDSGRYYIADLINNARRRIQEGKYDDAVARLYRTTELIAQYTLRRRYRIDTGNVDLSTLDAGIRTKYEGYRDERGRVKLGMLRAYELLNELGDEIAELFMNNHRLRDLLTRRNESILAHGVEPVGEGMAKELAEHVSELARAVVPEIDALAEKARFPEFEQLI